MCLSRALNAHLHSPLCSLLPAADESEVGPLPLQIFRRVGPSAVKLLLVPGIVEAFFDGAIAMPIFGMPPTFAFALGFILKAVGPALVIQAMFEVQQKRLGSTKRERPLLPPALL